jgi:hypothetical protein
MQGNVRADLAGQFSPLTEFCLLGTPLARWPQPPQVGGHGRSDHREIRLALGDLVSAAYGAGHRRLSTRHPAAADVGTDTAADGGSQYAWDQPGGGNGTDRLERSHRAVPGISVLRADPDAGAG